MATNETTSFGCKNEELPVIGTLVSINLKRDLSDFANFSPKFNADYVAGFDEKIQAAGNHAAIKLKTNERKIATSTLKKAITDLNTSLSHLTGYLELGKDTIRVSAADFGLTALRKSIRLKDAEGVMAALNLVIANISNYRAALNQQGFTEELLQRFTITKALIGENKQNQYITLSDRKLAVQENTGLFIDLFKQLNEILSIGKILYKTNTVKVKEYTFAYLKSQVRKASKPADTSTPVPDNPAPVPGINP